MACMPAFCLSIHARYQCRHAGACCRNWSVPAEPHVVHLVEQKGLRRSDVNGPLFVSSRNPDPSANLHIAKDQNGSCVFFEHDAGRLCVIHRHAGAAALPSACRHFPRKFLRDARGTFISLSHFCPTAAVLLLGAPALAVVDVAPPLMLDEPIEGLDARGALPPLLCPGVLCDLEGFDAWEHAALAVLACRNTSWQNAVRRIGAATDRVREWRPGGETLVQRVAGEFAEDQDSSGQPDVSDEQLVHLVWRLTDGRVPNDIQPIDNFEDLWTERVRGTFGRFDAAMKSYLAARLFASWVAYQGRGLRSIVYWMRAAGALVRHHAVRRSMELGRPPAPDDFVESVRMADLLLLHVIDTQAFAHAVAPFEDSKAA
jgi:Fe-S-cluster containining protein